MATFTTATEGAGSILPDQFAALITDPIEADALAFQPGVATTQRIGIGGSLRIPRVLDDAAAQWVAEGEEIPTSAPTLDELVVAWSKVAGLVPVSRELAEDSNPSAQGIVGSSLARAITQQIDAAFVGDLEAPAPAGLAALADAVTVIDGAGLANLDPILEARAAVEAAGGKATAILANPADALALAKLKDSTGSNRGLLESTENIDGVPVVRHAKITAGELWVVDASSIYTALREDVTLAVSDGPYFTSDRIAMRATARVGFAFPYPERIARVDLAA